MATDSAVAPILERLRKTFASGRTRDIAWRRGQLEALRRFCVECEPQIVGALQADYGKPAFDTKIAETHALIWEIDHALPRLARWMRRRRMGIPWAMWPGQGRIVPEPLGVALVIAPWNYPVQLLLSPLIGAIAAGNCAVLKPSELTPHTADMLKELLPRYLDNDAASRP